jgi:hypothetical protein
MTFSSHGAQQSTIGFGDEPEARSAEKGSGDPSLFMLAFATLGLAAGMPAKALNIVELTASNGALICPEYLGGPGVEDVVWDNSTSTCTITSTNAASPTVCIASSGTGCAEAAADQFIIDSGVTVEMTNQSNSWSQFCVYSTLVNNGTIEGGSYCNYGTIINNGKLAITRGNYFMNLPYNGFGILENQKGGEIINDYNFIVGGAVVNNGTFYNRGQVDNDNQYHGTFTNYGSYFGSAPCFSFNGCYTWLGTYNITSGALVNQLGNGILLSITGASASNVDIISENQTTAAPLGLGSLNISSALFYDVMVKGLSMGTARLCIANSRISQGMAGGMQYWSGEDWAFAGDQNVSDVPQSVLPPPNGTVTVSAPPQLMLCGSIPVMDLNGTPVGTGTPLRSSQGTTGSSQASSTSVVSSTTGMTSTGPGSSATITQPSGSPSYSSQPATGNWILLGLAAVVITVFLAVAITRWGLGPRTRRT